jgi:branched-chain amino acid transport system substrate-binding protein
MKYKQCILMSLVFVIIISFSFSSCGRKDEVIKLGATLPLTGEVASYGLKAKRGIELKIDEINSQGGILGKKIVVDFQDDKNDKKEAVSIFNKFATIDKFPVVFGSAGSTVTLAIAPLANRYKVILISPISSSAKLSTEGGEYFFRTIPADNLQAEILAKWVFNSGAKNVGIVYTNNSWGKPLSEDFGKIFTNLGGNILLNEGVVENTTDFRSVITKLKELGNLDAIVSPTYPKEGGVFIRQIKEMGLDVRLFGGDNWGAPEFINIAKDSAEGVFYTAPSQDKSPAYEEFAKKYLERFGEKPDVFSSYAYDAATAIFEAIEKAQSIAPEMILNALKDITFIGVSGEISFKSNGDLKSEAFDKKTIQNGQPLTVD